MFIGSTEQRSVQAISRYLGGQDPDPDGENKEIIQLVEQIFAADNGVVSYRYKGEDRLCAFSRVDGSVLGWYVAVTVRMSASPLTEAMKSQLYSAVLFLVVGAVAAFFLSKVTSQPFKKIERQNHDLAAMNATIQAQAASIMEERARIQLMLDATPLACRLWTRDFKLLDGNAAAVKLFGLKDKQEYLNRYLELSPEYQPDGQPTLEKIKETISEAFEKGECTHEWMYRLFDGTPLPCEQTMVRIPYGNDYVVAAYSRDLRDQIKMMTDIEHRDNLLDVSRRVSFTLFDTAQDRDIESVLAESMELLGHCVGVEQVHLVQMELVDQTPYFVCKSAWTSDALQTKMPIALGMSLPQQLDPEWDERFEHGECMNGPVQTLSGRLQGFFTSIGAKSVLVIPVFVREQFWGLVGFSDCKAERVFGADEVDILRSMSLIMAAAINRNEQDAIIRHTSEKLETALMDAERANTAKSDFLAHMSHEIRSPLNAVVGLSELMIGNDSLDQETIDRLETIYGSGMTILSIVNDILDLSKIESRKFVINPIRYDTPSLINDTIAQNIVRIGDKDITFKIDIDENLPGMLFGDDLRVKQIFNNLLSNAFKYTQEGSVEWHVTFEQDGEDIWLISSVKDSGIGIKPENMEELFAAYTQVDIKANHAIEGTGLGLAITQSLVQLMGGTITVESEYGKGSTFRVRLCQQLASSEPIGKEVAQNLMEMRYSLTKRHKNTKLPHADLSYARVLVVDDIVTNLDVVKGMLSPYNIKVDCVISAPQAIELIQSGTPQYNAIFMDHMMPGMDGIEATRIIREEIGTDYARNIPIIALTANAIAGNEAMFLANGFQAFISKPIDIAQLDFVLRQWVRDASMEKKLRRTIEKVPVAEGDASWTPPHIHGMNLNRAPERFGTDVKTFFDILRSYIKSIPPLLYTLRNHLEAKKLNDYMVVAHGIKGASYGVFADDVGKLAEALEMHAQAGDIAFVQSNHPVLEKRFEHLAQEIEQALAANESAIEKPVAREPDPALLLQLRNACGAYDMDGVDAAMERLESFRYERGEPLVAWLREQVSAMEFKKIYTDEWPVL